MGFSDIFKINQFKKQIEQLTNTNNEMSEKLTELGATDYYQVKEKINLSFRRFIHRTLIPSALL